MVNPRSSIDLLGECVDQLRSGEWRFVQLRDSTISRDCIDGDDVDLLGTPESIQALTDVAYEWVQGGFCHVQVIRSSPFKTALILYSVDGLHRVELDLWTEVCQFSDKGLSLVFEDCSRALAEAYGSIVRLRPSVEAAIYVHHLAAKRKDAGALKHQSRLADYVKRISASEPVNLSLVCERIRERGSVKAEDLERASECLRDFLDLSSARRNRVPYRWLRSRPYSRLLAAPRKTGAIIFMGCDGSGKTSMANHLKDDREDIERVFTGKHLYRKSWFYKLLVIFVRPLMFQDRERFDETFAFVAYVRAAIGLRLKLWRKGRGLMLIDRSLVDFLFVGRKTERPHFAWCRWLSSLIGCRIPTVHFILPYERMRERKQEISEEGQRRYDEAMFGHFTRRCPTHYVVFNNGGDLESSASAVSCIIDHMRNPG